MTGAGTGGGVWQAGTVLEPREFWVTRADLVGYAEASGDHNPIHVDEEVALAVGLPGVIAHGMYTLGLAARAVAGWTGGAQVLDLGAPHRRGRADAVHEHDLDRHGIHPTNAACAPTGDGDVGCRP